MRTDRIFLKFLVPRVLCRSPFCAVMPLLPAVAVSIPVWICQKACHTGFDMGASQYPAGPRQVHRRTPLSACLLLLADEFERYTHTYTQLVGDARRELPSRD